MTGGVPGQRVFFPRDFQKWNLFRTGGLHPSLLSQACGCGTCQGSWQAVGAAGTPCCGCSAPPVWVTGKGLSAVLQASIGLKKKKGKIAAGQPQGPSRLPACGSARLALTPSRPGPAASSRPARFQDGGGGGRQPAAGGLAAVAGPRG